MKQDHKVRVLKSICGNYKLFYTNHVSEGEIKSKDGILYKQKPKEGKDGNYYSLPHMITSYSAGAKDLSPKKYFTVRFADCKNGVRIIPFQGNTVIKTYEAIFRVQNK